MTNEVHTMTLQEAEARDRLNRDYMETYHAYDAADGEAKEAQLARLRELVKEAAESSGFSEAIPEQTPAYQLRVGGSPKQTIKVYKVFTMADDGRPTALFISGTEKLPKGVWLDAQDAYHFRAANGNDYVPSTQNPYTEGGKTGASIEIPSEEVRQELIARGFLPKGSKAKKITALAYRPGWHAGTLPFFPQGGKKAPAGSPYPNVHRYNQVVFECEIAADENYTEAARAQEKARTKDGRINLARADLQSIPEGGFYYYTTNPLLQNNPDLGAWVITGSIKINRALTQEECDRILAENNMEPQAWEGGSLDLTALGHTSDESEAARKTLAPITYDDAGNVIPLADRFNAEVQDVRYQERAGEAAGLTEGIALEGEEEKALLEALGPGGRQVYREAKELLSGGNAAVQNAASVSAALLASRAVVWSEEEKRVGRKASAIDYWETLGVVPYLDHDDVNHRVIERYKAAMYPWRGAEFRNFIQECFIGNIDTMKAYFRLSDGENEIDIPGTKFRHVQYGEHDHPLAIEQYIDLSKNILRGIKNAGLGIQQRRKDCADVLAHVPGEISDYAVVMHYFPKGRILLGTVMPKSSESVEKWLNTRIETLTRVQGSDLVVASSLYSLSSIQQSPQIIKRFEEIRLFYESQKDNTERKQRDAKILQGKTAFLASGKRKITLFEAADETTFLHEMAHVLYDDLHRLSKTDGLAATDFRLVSEWARWKEGQVDEYRGTPWEEEFFRRDQAIRDAIAQGDANAVARLQAEWREERFARGFERYLAEGTAPTSALGRVFERCKRIFQNAYAAFRGSGGRASPAVEDVMARLVTPASANQSIKPWQDRKTERSASKMKLCYEGNPAGIDIRNEALYQAVKDGTLTFTGQYHVGHKTCELTGKDDVMPAIYEDANGEQRYLASEISEAIEAGIYWDDAPKQQVPAKEAAQEAKPQEAKPAPVLP